MKYTSFLRAFLFGFILISAISCDKDFNEIGADFVDSDHYGFDTQKYEVKAYNQPTGEVQTNNLPINSLGYYNNPVFGRTSASFVTQLELDKVNPTFVDRASVVVDSVYLHVPYFSTYVNTEENGDSNYQLQSVYGDTSKKIKLEVFRSSYYLRNLDPNPISGLLEQQSYFSNDNFIGNDSEATYPQRLNSGDNSQNDNFQFSPSQIKFLKTNSSGQIIVPNVVRERLVPGIYMDLDQTTFRDDIIRANPANLLDNNAFKNYYRGIYFKVSAHAGDPNSAALAMLNFAQGKIVIVYRDKKLVGDAAPTVRKTMTLNMKGYTVNLLDQQNSPAYTSALGSANSTTGDAQLFVKGGVGSLSVIELFGGAKNSTSSDLNNMRADKWLVNEASLIFNIDTGTMGTGTPEPDRVYLYDLQNKRPLIDYYYDTSTQAETKFNKYIHGGIINKVSSDDRGTKYKIRITNHIRNLIKYQDSTNVKLGLVITENINSVTNFKLKNPFSYLEMNLVSGMFETKQAKTVPAMSVMGPLGTVLHGSNIPTGNVNYAKRLQLEIVYTKPD